MAYSRVTVTSHNSYDSTSSGREMIWGMQTKDAEVISIMFDIHSIPCQKDMRI